MEKKYDDVDIFVFISVAIAFIFIALIGGVKMGFESILNQLGLSGGDIPINTLIAGFIGVIALCYLIKKMWEIGKDKNTGKEWWNHPLGLPNGSIRALIALLFIAMILFFGGAQTWLTGIVGTIVGFYFGERKSPGDGKIIGEDEEDAEESDSGEAENETGLDDAKKLRDNINSIMESGGNDYQKIVEDIKTELEKK